MEERLPALRRHEARRPHDRVRRGLDSDPGERAGGPRRRGGRAGRRRARPTAARVLSGGRGRPRPRRARLAARSARCCRSSARLCSAASPGARATRPASRSPASTSRSRSSSMTATAAGAGAPHGALSPLPVGPDRPAAGALYAGVPDEFARELAEAVSAGRGARRADHRAAEGWTADRLGTLERNILRVGSRAGGGRRAARGGDQRGGRAGEAVCSEDAARLVNGILARWPGSRRRRET